MTSPSRTRSTVEVLKWRERKRRLALERLSRTVAKQRSDMATTDSLIAALRDHLQATLDSRFGAGAQSVSALSDIDQHSRNLRAHGEELLKLRRRAESALNQLLAEQQAGARLWRRSEAALEHLQSIAHRERISREIRQLESDEQEWRGFDLERLR